MAKARTAGSTLDVQDAELLPYNDPLEYDPDSERAFDDLREQLTGTESAGTVWVYRVPTDEHGETVSNAKHIMLFSYPVQRYTLEELVGKVRKDYMKPGEKMCVRISATQKGERGLKFNRIMLLERENAPEPPAAGQGRESIAEIMRAIQESNAQQMAAFQHFMQRTLESRPPAPQVDPTQTALQMVAGMTAMLAQLNKPAPAASAAPDMLGMIKTMREMKRFSSELSGDGGGAADGEGDPDSLLSLLKAGAPYVALLAQARAHAPAASPQRLAGPAHPPLLRRRKPPENTPTIQSPSVTPPGGAAPTVEIDPMFAQLRPQLEALTNAAKEGSDPKAAAEMVIMQIPEGSPLEAQFLDFLERPNWFVNVCAIYPPAREQAEWFAKLREAILAEFDAEESPESAT